jgi:hypothetical protein
VPPEADAATMLDNDEPLAVKVALGVNTDGARGSLQIVQW